MPTITNLTLQQRNKNRVNVFLDGAYAFAVQKNTAVSLHIGQMLDEEALHRLHEQEGAEQAKEAALRLISQRPRSVAEVRQRLQAKGFDTAVIEPTLTRLQELKLLDDAAFAQYWVEQRETFKPRSARALQQELAQKGIDRATTEASLQTTGFDEQEAAYRAGAKKAHALAHLPYESFAQKLGSYLQRRGFGYGVSKEVIAQLWQELSV
jgi:regulatory protein